MTTDTSPASNQQVKEKISQIRKLPAALRWVPASVTVILILMTLDYLFNLGLLTFVTGLETQFYYAVVALLLPLVFLLWPMRNHQQEQPIPWYDYVLSAITLIVGGYFVYNAVPILERGWAFSAPDIAIYASYAYWVLIIEAARRAGGLPIAIIAGVFSLYPLVADIVPGPIQAFPSTLEQTAMYHTMSTESIMGVPLQAFAGLVIGFLVFGVVLQKSGGGKFFINLAFALLGHVRGGPAKVSIFSSGLMGSMSGSVISNVLTTGVLSIPAMRRIGMSRSFAGGVEACASTGGVLMPPVMGATAFVMAMFLDIPYSAVALAAVIPSVLYFLGLFIQIDAYAARHDIKGLPAIELPSLKQTLKEGWYFIFVFALLVWMLLIMQREAVAPFYATALLLVLNQLSKHNRWGWADVADTLSSAAKLFAELIAILAGVGMLVGALSMTGLSGTIANDFINIAGGSVPLLLIMGAVTSFVLGIGMTVTAAYIFLAVALAPALIQGGGLDPMAVHMFILYWGMLSFITPPVALGAFAAATVAGARPMATGLQAMRLGSVIYFIPFLFVLNPALIMQGAPLMIVAVFIQAVIGIILFASAMQGYLMGVGRLGYGALQEIVIRGLVLIAGLLLALPGGGMVPFSQWELVGLAVAALIPGVLLARWSQRHHQRSHNASVA
ncbi:TRAP transporter permease [Vreelandella populi]|uniref:TRAP transporter fused permease subunit n=1 Tax=Vreelandella populi TaxID=2498858 RepID=A0A3S0WHE8_9GAMM|nr:TRAP transporter fused permease subunit [Halomonas populi]RUR38601.1 TRAP transporter fused permease subunit [Halomonas populi]RUR43306.1 TRAP transporter fused permease subunit [Halomonas populi]RUR51673.1 TRAP transporter fused permease subunit [Halomonas populi]